MCDHRLLDDPNGLRCTRVNCDGRGHTYESTSARDAEDSLGGQG